MFKTIVLANWGPGLELLKVMNSHSEIEIDLLVSQYDKDSDDKWKNCVIKYGQEVGIPTVKNTDISFDWLRGQIVDKSIDLLVCFSFMRILPKEVISAPKHGSINIHPSLLPKYRGPAPAYWAIKDREPKTGLTVHFMDEGVDTGDIITQVEIELEPEDDMASLLEKQKKVMGSLVNNAINLLKDKSFKPLKQDEAFVSYSPKV